MCEHYVCLIEFGEESKQNEILEYLSLVWILMTFVYWYEFDLLTIKWQTFNFIYLRTTSTRQSMSDHPFHWDLCAFHPSPVENCLSYFILADDLTCPASALEIGSVLLWPSFTNLSPINNSFKPNTSQFSLFMVSFNIPMPHFCFDF